MSKGSHGCASSHEVSVMAKALADVQFVTAEADNPRRVPLMPWADTLAAPDPGVGRAHARGILQCAMDLLKGTGTPIAIRLGA